MFELMETIVPLFFILVIGIILFQLFRGVSEWSHNNTQPVLTVESRVVAKRNHVSRSSHHHSDHTNHHTSTTYYVTFEVESGDRMELKVSFKEYGLLAEGDQGKLTFQGTRYHGFDRHRGDVEE
ncbi:DUF2500 domain-containing protein [Caldalkalibacillus mannanilyticus]|uniref:DUF2500 domain-containing protein n=1 Tax=Caldalkalibacillus mannanilyticus TaxID=1418 RepID=UPI000468370F|nr:DUF2500 domain-containing protein [Caldalkalibacillus mannanilyticus]